MHLLLESELLFDSFDEPLLKVPGVHWQHGELPVQLDPEMSTFATCERGTLPLKPSLELAAFHLTIINNFVYLYEYAPEDSICGSFRSGVEPKLETETGGAGCGECCGWRFGDFDLAVEQVFASGEKFEALAEVM